MTVSRVTGSDGKQYDVTFTVTPAATVTISSVVPVVAATAGPFASQTGDFTISWTATPTESAEDVVMGLCLNAPTAFTSFACGVRFSNTGVIEVRDGAVYDATSVVPYIANATFVFRLIVRLSNHTYDVFVTPQGQSEVPLATNFAFRTEQANVASLNYFGEITVVGDAIFSDISAPSPVTTVPPPAGFPVAPVPDVTNFSSSNGSSIQVCGHTFQVEHAGRSWSIGNPNSQTVRFEVRPGDKWANDGGNNVERSELEGQIHYPAGESFGYNRATTVRVSYEFMMESGSLNAAQWMVLGQWHGTVSNQPPFYFALLGEKISANIRGTNNSVETRLWTGDLVRGQWYAFDVKINFAAGTCLIVRDGVQIANYTGAIGVANERFYWKHGIYRSSSSDTKAANYRNFVISP